MSNARIYSANGTMVYVADKFLADGSLFGTNKVIVSADGNNKVYWKRADQKEFTYHNKKNADKIIQMAKDHLK